MSSVSLHPPRFIDRADAGAALGRTLVRWRGAWAAVFGIPPGGVPIAVEVAAALELPLQFAAIRAIPSETGSVIGAVDAIGSLTCNPGEERRAGISGSALEAAIAAARRDLDHVLHRLPFDAFRPTLDGRTAILVDDVTLSPAPAMAAIGWARKLGARYVVYAAPAGRARALATIKPLVDQLVVLGRSAELDDGSEVYALSPAVTDAEIESAFAHFSTGRLAEDQPE